MKCEYQNGINYDNFKEKLNVCGKFRVLVSANLQASAQHRQLGPDAGSSQMSGQAQGVPQPPQGHL